ncbi:ubiquitin-conjugating enzyme E2 U [Latimeria chalumnae]|uniref:Ubiquitin conjugating enzyme E2 U n=1 Tax=Latimeria chalumnae TaxID=7897 RepID=M3XLP4_LATCH|nr:PREDICTED: ubiquitin-conjugating enzyme E2 U [Latimeria chalumnae]XP_014349864.1 PREDICTED: ubiquitin-conjugating enzyme E2 U [Latimeria chalumnae]XP_014349865.1 PREDICTED: ubiquitin-conjugating enzyme E2 U [Latimeria chalumnae]XP_014349866.1 PREDICTED: ubiquitin-conjugating enzyme E2 U [Latimeria chalumnae]|eukprot:XP_014349863.1 PREDICTED: ubiquitin-conjugating enzyme E2 U [Latimeria chalumnae]
MHSRAYLLLERDYIELVKNNLYGIFAFPVSENLLEWVVKIQGLKDSLWEGGTVQLSLTYTEEYNNVPPRVIFNTVPFHPNVDKNTGRPCIDFLDNPEEWSENCSLMRILLTIQVLLSNPVLENAVNVEAAELLKTNPALYRQMVLECVKTSQLLEGEIELPKDDDIPIPQLQETSTVPEQEHLNRNIQSISFENYYKTWTEIATSKLSKDFQNPLLAQLESHPRLQAMHYGVQGMELEKEIKAQNKIYCALVYGAFNIPRRMQVMVDEKLVKLNRMEVNNLFYRNSVPFVQEQMFQLEGLDTSKHDANVHEEEPWEKEVDNLVTWTNSLSFEELEAE